MLYACIFICRFIYVPSPHTAEALSDVLMKCLMDWHVDKNISTLTLDNCSTNDALITLMNRKLRKETFVGWQVVAYVLLRTHIKFNCQRWFGSNG